VVRFCFSDIFGHQLEVGAPRIPIWLGPWNYQTRLERIWIPDSGDGITTVLLTRVKSHLSSADETDIATVLSAANDLRSTDNRMSLVALYDNTTSRAVDSLSSTENTTSGAVDSLSSTETNSQTDISYEQFKQLPRTYCLVCVILSFYQFSYTAPSAGQLPRETNSRSILSTDGVCKLLGIKWYCCVQNDDLSWTTEQRPLSAIVQARRLSLFGHTAHLPDETDAKILTASPLENWRRPPGRPHNTWIKTIQQDLESFNRSLSHEPCLRLAIRTHSDECQK